MIHHAHKLGRALHSLSTYYARNPDKIIDHGSTAANYGGQALGATGRFAMKHGPTAAKHTAIFTGKIAGKATVHISKMVWNHGPKVAKHTTKFMVKSAIKGFKLFSRS